MPSATEAGSLRRQDGRIAEALVRLNRAVQRASIYPGGHPAIPAAVKAFVLGLRNALDERPVLLVGVASDRLVVEGVSLDERRSALSWLTAQLRDRGLASFAIDRGVAEAELVRFVEWLARPSPPKEDARFVGIVLARIDYAKARFVDAPFARAQDPARLWETLASNLTTGWYLEEGPLPEDPQALAQELSAHVLRHEGVGAASLLARIEAIGGAPAPSARPRARGDEATPLGLRGRAHPRPAQPALARRQGREPSQGRLPGGDHRRPARHPRPGGPGRHRPRGRTAPEASLEPVQQAHRGRGRRSLVARAGRDQAPEPRLARRPHRARAREDRERPARGLRRAGGLREPRGLPGASGRPEPGGTPGHGALRVASLPGPALRGPRSGPTFRASCCACSWPHPTDPRPRTRCADCWRTFPRTSPPVASTRLSSEASALDDVLARPSGVADEVRPLAAEYIARAIAPEVVAALLKAAEESAEPPAPGVVGLFRAAGVDAACAAFDRLAALPPGEGHERLSELLFLLEHGGLERGRRPPALDGLAFGAGALRPARASRVAPRPRPGAHLPREQGCGDTARGVPVTARGGRGRAPVPASLGQSAR